MSLIQEIYNEYFECCKNGYPPKKLELFGDTYHEFMIEISKNPTFNVRDINSNKFLGMEIIKNLNPTWRFK